MGGAVPSRDVEVEQVGARLAEDHQARRAATR